MADAPAPGRALWAIVTVRNCAVTQHDVPVSLPLAPLPLSGALTGVLSGVLLAGLLTAAGPALAGTDFPDAGDPTVARAEGRATPPVPFPANPHGLPAQADWGREIEASAGYQPQTFCAANPMRGIVALRNLVLRTYGPGSDAGAIRSCAVGGQSEHKEGRAWDWAVDVGDRQERRAAADFLAWLTARGRDGKPGAMARRLGVMYVIYNRKIWSGWSGGWENYSGYSPHTDHVHISLSWNGARGHTSFWTGRVWRTDVGTCAYFANQPGRGRDREGAHQALPQSGADATWLDPADGVAGQQRRPRRYRPATARLAGGRAARPADPATHPAVAARARPAAHRGAGQADLGQPAAADPAAVRAQVGP